MDDQRTKNEPRNNRILKQDDSGNYYKDIVFVPSGTLAMKKTAKGPSNLNKDEDAVDVREFYKTVLAMPSPRGPKNTHRKRKTALISRSTDRSSPISSMPTAPTQSIPPPPPTAQTSASGAPNAVPNPISTDASEITRRNWQVKKNSPARIVAEGYILCESCKIEVREDDLDRHRQGTAHLMSQESSIQPLDTLTLGRENKGFRMLVNSGWEYEKGLGVQGQGARHPVATRLKHDRLALGAAGTSKKVVTHTFEEIEKSRAKPIKESNRRVPLSAEDYRRKAEMERKARINLMNYMKK
ncbi:G patch domain and ankyrin repeat-containing protein 1 [Mortierella polycephala]|uniref:G patch domain and ankyrin repeat-containing protein 1 n=1 Tax=Mortierella polycephala TaxID=41804 RepID=A0A9P6U404_9FUNG|nr:G patch domain and ankyrin repeat-containing protein 1 [Mortierella polycephala]